MQQAIDSLKKVRPTTSEEDVRRENGKLKVQLAALGNMDKTRAQLAHELAEIKTRLSEKEKEILESKNHNARAAFTEQRAAIKEFTDRVQAELEKENRNLQTRSAMAEEQIKEINAYMAQSTLAYQKEIMRLRSIIQATAPERLRSPRGIGGGGGGGGETGGEHPKNLRASKAGLDAVRAVGGMNRSFDARAEKRRGATRGAARERTGGGQVGERRDLTGRVVRAIGVVTSEARLDSPLARGILNVSTQSPKTYGYHFRKSLTSDSPAAGHFPHAPTRCRPRARPSSRRASPAMVPSIPVSRRVTARPVAVRAATATAPKPAKISDRRVGDAVVGSPAASSRDDAASVSAAPDRDGPPIPVVDLASSDEACVSVVREALFEGVGFFHVRNHGVPPDAFARVADSAAAFFDAPVAEKRALAVGDMKLSRGYEVSPEHVAAMFSESDVSVEAERADPEPSAARRLVGERFSAGPFRRPRDAYHAGEDGAVFFAPNAWPSENHELREHMEAYYKHMEALSNRVLRLIALAANAPPDFFINRSDRHCSNLQVANYPTLRSGDWAAPDAAPPRKKAHADSGTITILARERNLQTAETDRRRGGLQVLVGDDVWADVPDARRRRARRRGGLRVARERRQPAPGVERRALAKHQAQGHEPRVRYVRRRHENVRRKRLDAARLRRVLPQSQLRRGGGRFEFLAFGGFARGGGARRRGAKRPRRYRRRAEPRGHAEEVREAGHGRGASVHGVSRGAHGRGSRRRGGGVFERGRIFHSKKRQTFASRRLRGRGAGRRGSVSLLPACFRRRLGFRPRERRPRRRLGERQPFGAVSGVQGHGLETVRPVRRHGREPGRPVRRQVPQGRHVLAVLGEGQDHVRQLRRPHGFVLKIS